MSGLRRALIGLAVAGFALGLAALALATTSDREQDPTVWIVLALTLGWGFAGAGIYAWWRRPENRTGPLMTLVGFVWFLGALSSADAAWAYTIGVLVGTLWIGALVHMLVAFPTGRVEPGLERAVVIAGWAASAVLPLLAALVTAEPNGCDDCPDNLVLVWDSATASDVVQGIGLLVSVVLLAGLCVVLIRRWRDFGKVQRRALSPVIWTGAAVAGLGVASVIPIVVGADTVSQVVDTILIVLITALPFAFLLGLMRSSLSRAGAVSALFERLGGVSARDALAEALGDESLALAYWLPDTGRYVDAEGHTVALPADGGDRAVTVIERDGAPVAAIVHDPALLDDVELVRTAGVAAALALQSERLAAEVRARYDDLRAASARLVAAGDAARRRIERDLHDGAQQRLVALSVTLNLARKHVEPGSPTATLLDSAMAELTAGLSELRELARGIHPAVLTERGLDPALQVLAARAPLPVTISGGLAERLPPAVESAAYFVVMEALTNVAKYASATTAEVTVQRVNGHVTIDIADDGVGGADPASGSGLTGLADRVAALGGWLVVESPPGGGTVVRARMPAP
ncbi:MAG TPA: histidine kinase [Solirubrobacteraceae bacterium]|jgi:signal transduction histidine kinase